MELAFGEWVKQQRRILDLTQEELAKRAFCSIHTIRKIETGDFKPSQALTLEIARALDLPPENHEAFVRFARNPAATAPDDAFMRQKRETEVVEAATSFTPPSPVKFQPPAPLTAALGREQDTGVIIRVLRLPSVRLATLTGPPGTGKTRLSLEVAAALQSEFEFGAAFVPLAPLAQNAPIENAIAQVLHVNESAETTVAEALVKFLRDKEVLLVLDNFEHLLSSNGASVNGGYGEPPAVLLVADLLTRAPRLKILATSREPLRVYGERELPIQPLSVPPLTPLPPLSQVEMYSAVQLFAERAQAANPNWTLTAANAQAVAELCAGLDGLPLAIEMAAARVKWETPEALLPKLTHQLKVFKSTARDHSPRQQTLRGAISWSYDLLDESEQLVLQHLGVFRGSFGAQAASAVCGFPVEEVLGNLQDKSLVKREDDPEGGARLMLLEMIREYAVEKLEASGEAERARERHWAFFLAFAQRAQTDALRGAAPAMSHLKPDYDNARRALDWAIASGRAEQALMLGAALAEYRYSAFGIQQGMRWLADVLAMDLPAKTEMLPARARVRLIYADYLRVSGEPSQARPLLIETIDECRRLGEMGKPILGMALSALSRLALRQGDWETAHDAARESLDIFIELNDLLSQGAAWRGIGEWAMSQGEYTYARECLDHAVVLQRPNENYYGYAVSLLERGDIARAMEDYTLARQDYEASFEANQRVQDKFVEYRSIHRLGILSALEGDPVGGRRQIVQAVHCSLNVGSRTTLGSFYSSLAMCAAILQQTEKALLWLGIAGLELAHGKTVLIGPERLEYERTVELVRGQASEEQLAEWRAAGQGLSFEQIMSLLDAE